LLQQNGWIPLGSDFPVEHINPLYTFHAAVARQDAKNWPDGGFQMENALTREEALRGMTIWAAQAAFEEKEKGSIEPGKFADFVILEEDLMKVAPDKMRNLQVLYTYLNGKQVYKK
jgi:predicted amidohydrolase YtcJ